MTQHERNPSQRWPDELSLDGDGGPALPISDAQSDALVAAALRKAHSAPDSASVQPGQQPLSRTPGTRLPLQVAAAALLVFLGLGSASAAVLWWARRDEPASVSPPAPSRERERPEAAEQPPSEAKQPIAAEPEPVVPPASARRAVRAPEDFLDEANRLRAAARWREADEAYARVWKAAPESAAAYVARVAAASVRLEHRNDARGALASYRAALAQSPRGPLGEEARFGVAEALRLLGDTRAERQALERFLVAHPDSPLAARARARLDTLVRAEPTP